jgi:hypothetical protein
MKTNITILITICALGFVGLNANAANYRSTDLGAVSETRESLPTAEISGTTQFFLNEDFDAVVDFQKEAQMLTKWLADKEEAKAVQKLIEEGFFTPTEIATIAENTESNLPVLNENAQTRVDFQQEAQLVTKWVADKAEAKAVQKLIEEGKLAENE